MRILILGLSLTVSSLGWATCSFPPDITEELRELHASYCIARPSCLQDQIETLERGLEQPGDQLLRLRRHQDVWLEKARLTEDSEAAQKLAQWYAERADLDSEKRAYLLARKNHDVDALEQAADPFPLAWLDLLRGRHPGVDFEPVGTERGEELLGRFLDNCPASAEWLISEARDLRLDPAWASWREIRQALLANESPPWDSLREGWLVFAEQQLAARNDQDPVKQLLTETDSMTDSHGHQAGFWAYRAAIHNLDRAPEQAQEAIDRALAIDPCYPFEAFEYHFDPKQRYATLSRAVLECTPRFSTWSGWLFLSSNSLESIDPEALARIRQGYDDEIFGAYTRTILRSLAQLDLAKRHQPEKAWERLAEDFEEQQLEIAEISESRLAAELRLQQVSRAQSLARTGLRGEDKDKGLEWFQRTETLWAESLEDQATLAVDHPLISFTASRRSELRWLKARARGRPAEAVGHAFEAHRESFLMIELDEVLDYWLETGGTQEQFDAMLASHDMALPAQGRGWRRMDSAMPEFELTDMNGEPWQTADLSGHHVMVNLWATWCGPCMIELPKVQELHEHYADDPSVQIITINLDRDNPVARRMVEREGWTFPVLLGGAGIEDFAKLGLPRNWLADKDSIRHWEQTGFSMDIADHWVGDIVSLLEAMSDPAEE